MSRGDLSSRPVLAPQGLRQYTLLYTGQVAPRLVPLGGETPITILPNGPSDPERPLLVSGGVVFVHRGLANFYDTAAPERFHPLVPADHVFPMVWPGLVGVQRGLGPSPVNVQFVSTAGARTTDSPVWQLPSGYQPLAQAGSGLLVMNGLGQLRTWSLADQQLDRFLGIASTVVDVHGDQVAWRARSGCDTNGECPLHLTNATTGDDRLIPPPPGHGGFVDGGAFSPTGTTLAAFVGAEGPNKSPGASLVLIKPASGTSTPVHASVVQVGEPIGMAAWTPDEAAVFFCGNNGTMHVYRPGDRRGLTLNLPASYSFVVW